MHAARGDGGVEALLLDGRADQQAPIGAGHHVQAVPDHDSGAHPLTAPLAQGDYLALDRANPGPLAGVQPLGLTGIAAGREDQVLRRALASVRGADRARRAGVRPDHLHALLDAAAAHPHRRGQGGNERPRVGRTLVRDEHAAGKPWRQAGLQLAARAGSKPLGLQVVLAVQLVLAPQLLGLVPIERHVKRPAPRIAGVHPARIAELLGKGGPQGVGGEIQFQQTLLAPRGLADRGEHARCDVAGAGADLVALEHADAQSTSQSRPGACEADWPAADDQDIESLSPL